jgi:hypothetical protein
MPIFTTMELLGWSSSKARYLAITYDASKWAGKNCTIVKEETAEGETAIARS